MSVSNLAAIAGAIAQTYAPEANRLWNRQAALISTLAVKESDGKALYWAVSNSGALASTVAEGSDIGSGEYLIDDKVSLTLNRGIYRAAFGLSHSEINSAMSAKNSSDIITNLLAESFLGSLSAIASKVNKDAWTGTGTDGSANNCIVGLIGDMVTAALATGGSYGGASRASYVGLKTNAQTSVGTLAASHFDKAFADIFTQSGSVPNAIFMSAGTARVYKALFNTNQRFVVQGDQLPRVDLGMQRAPEMNVPVMFFNGVPILQDKDLPDGYAVVCDTNDIELCVLPSMMAGDAVSQRSAAALSSNGREVEPLRIPVNIYPVAKSGSSVKFAMEVECQLKVRRPNATALLSGITVT